MRVAPSQTDRLRHDLHDAIGLIYELMDESVRALDHDGFCQTHVRAHPCPHGEARAFLYELAFER